MDFRKYLDQAAKELDREVENILKQQLSEVGKVDKKLIPLFKAFARLCRGGKRIRGALAKLGYEIAGGKSKEIIKVAAAYEIMHAAVLAHDDIMDKSLTRRGKPSLYAALGGNHYGISQAVCLGDYGFFLAFKIIAKTNAAEVFSQIMMDTACGQMLDIEKADPKVVMRLKTACYTIAGPLKLGAVLAGADKRQIQVLNEFGENLGIAYQIRDDILDEEVVSVESAKKEAEEYTNKAMKTIPQITNSKNLSKILEQMGECLVERKK